MALHLLKLTDDHLDAINEGLQHVAMRKAFPAVQAINTQLQFEQEQQQHSYEQLAESIRSGQVSAAQVAEHMRDEVFARWYAGRYP
jgi:cytochrome c-type biogenesis protein CcmH/NrfF